MYEELNVHNTCGLWCEALMRKRAQVYINQKMRLGVQTESFQNVGGGKGVYNVLTFQKSRGGQELT